MRTFCVLLRMTWSETLPPVRTLVTRSILLRRPRTMSETMLKSARAMMPSRGSPWVMWIVVLACVEETHSLVFVRSTYNTCRQDSPHAPRSS